MSAASGRPPIVVGVTVNFIGPDEQKCPSRFGCFYLNKGYVENLRRAGGIPLALPYVTDPTDVDAILDRIDALMLTGGKDLDPAQYGEDRHPSSERILPDRSASEIALTRRAIERKIPVLGICLGLQTLNVAFGGTLVQDIPTQAPTDIEHRQGENERERPSHPVDVQAGSLLERVLGARQVMVNSVHHQAVKAVGQGLVVSARAPDAVIEGLERPGEPFCLSVQWHPEDLQEREPHRRLFEALIEAARRSSGKKSA